MQLSAMLVLSCIVYQQPKIFSKNEHLPSKVLFSLIFGKNESFLQKMLRYFTNCITEWALSPILRFFMISESLPHGWDFFFILMSASYSRRLMRRMVRVKFPPWTICRLRLILKQSPWSNCLLKRHGNQELGHSDCRSVQGVPWW